jgi:hypothetical protein
MDPRKPKHLVSLLAFDLTLGLAVVLTFAAIAAYLLIPFAPPAFFPRPRTADNTAYRIFQLRGFLILWSAWLIAFVLYPWSTLLVAGIRERWRPVHTAASLVVASTFIAWFILHFGNRQFGAFDFGFLIDTGWRQIIGQRAYSDFPIPMPPAFTLGIKYAFQAFGVNWDAQLLLAATVAVGSFWWLYWLLLKLTGNRMAAFWVAMAAEGAIHLEVGFWWYNGLTEIFALLFFLSCLHLGWNEESPAAQMSYYFSLWPLPLMKPNIAGLMALTGVAVVLFATGRKRRAVVFTILASLTTALFLLANRISIPDMLACYRAAAIERGLSFYGLALYSTRQRVLIFGWALVLGFPIAILLPAMLDAFRRKQWRRLAVLLAFPAIVLITFFGIVTNGEFKDVDAGKLMVASSVVLFGRDMPKASLGLKRFYSGVVCSLLLVSLFYGVTRVRVFGIGPHLFFEWMDADHPVPASLFAHMRSSRRFAAVVEEIGQAVSSNRGPFFMGPRLEMGYALTRLPSPDHWPVIFDPGNVFARRDIGKLLQQWQDRHFRTLIFLKDDYPYYTPEFKALIHPNGNKDDVYPYYTPEFKSLIHSNYSQDDAYRELTIYHARD